MYKVIPIGDNITMKVSEDARSTAVRFAYDDGSADVLLLDPTYAELDGMIKALSALRRLTPKTEG